MTTKLSDLHALSNFELRKRIAEMIADEFGGTVTYDSDLRKLFFIGEGCGYCESPNWPESIEAAFSLIEDLLDKNYSFSLLDLSSVPDRYMMHVRQRGSARLLHYTTAPTAPRAICEAYYMTMQKEVSDDN